MLKLKIKMMKNIPGMRMKITKNLLLKRKITNNLLLKMKMTNNLLLKMKVTKRKKKRASQKKIHKKM